MNLWYFQIKTKYIKNVYKINMININVRLKCKLVRCIPARWLLQLETLRQKMVCVELTIV